MFNQVLIYIPGTVFPLIISLISSAIYTRVFSTAEYGKFSLAISITALTTTLSYQWLQQAISRYLPSQISAQSRAEIKEAVVGSFALIIIFQFILLLVAFILYYTRFDKNLTQLALSSSLLIIVMSLFVPMTVIFQAEMNAKRYTLYNLINSILKLTLGAGIVFLFYGEAGGLVWGYVLSYLLLIPILWHHTQLPSLSILFSRQNLASIWRKVKQFAAYGAPMIGWFFASNILSVGDRYLIQFFKGTSEVGIYSANYSLVAGSVSLIALPIQLAAHPFLVKAWSDNDKEGTLKWLGIIIEYSISLGILLIGCILLFSKDIAYLLLGPEFRQGHTIMPIVFSGILFWQLGTYTHKPLEFAERTQLMMLFCLVAACFNVILNVIFIPKFGYVAAAYTTVLSYILYNILVTIAGRKIVRWHVNLRTLIMNLMQTTAGIYLIWFVRQKLEIIVGYSISTLIALLGCVALSILIYYRNNYFNFFNLIRKMTDRFV